MLMQRPRHQKLTRSRTNRVLAGVFGGFAAYFGISATWLRIAYLVLTALSGLVPGIMIYVMTAIIMPPAPSSNGALDNFFWGNRGTEATKKSRRELQDVEEEDVKRGADK